MSREGRRESPLTRELGELSRRVTESELRAEWYSRAERAAARRANRLGRLAELGLGLTGDPVDVFRRIAAMIGELLDVPVVNLSEIRGEELFVLSTFSADQAVSCTGTYKLQNTPCAAVRKSRNLRIFHDVMKEFPDAAFLQKYNAYSYCGFPALDSTGTVTAVISVLDDKPHEFSEEDRDLLKILAQRIGLELERQKHLDAQARKDEELRRAVQLAEEEKERSKAIVAAIGDGISIQDRDFMVLYQNDIHKGYRGNQIGKYCYQAYEGRGSVCEGCPVDRSTRSGSICRAVRSVPNGSGRAYYEITASPLRDAAGGVIAGVEVVRDITGRKLVEESLAAEKEQLAVTLRSIRDGVITTDVEGRVVLMNPVAEDLTGWTQDEAAGRPLAEVFLAYHEKTFRRCDNFAGQVIDTGAIPPGCQHTRLVSRRGRERVVANSGSPIYDRAGAVIGVVLVCRDLTETRRMEAELLKMEKLESLGVLAGGIAHDFNNILAGIIGFLSVGTLYARDNAAVRDVLGKAEKAAIRAKNLTNQLLTFSKGSWPVKKSASVGDLIAESVQFVLSGSNVKCDLRFPDDLWTVDVDEGQFHQVICNLVINAKDAMPEGGTVGIFAENVSVDAPRDMPLSPGRHVKVSIEDNGHGIAREHLGNVFDPYFTTKPAGNGLGLATVYSIISKHGGHITVRSEQGAGTIFDIYLPASSKQEQAADHCQELPCTGTGHILVMDDDDTVRTAVGEMVQALGYTAALTRDGRETIECYRRALAEGRPFDAVIVDMTIPGGMGGQETAAKLLELDPSVAAIISSGYAQGPLISRYRDYGFRDILFKPFSILELGRVLRNALGTSERRGDPPASVTEYAGRSGPGQGDGKGRIGRRT